MSDRRTDTRATHRAADAHHDANAIPAIEQLLRAAPLHAEAHYQLAHALQGVGRLDEAIVSYRRAIELRPHFPEAFNDLGVALWITHQQGAIEAVRHAIELRPGYVDALNNLGVMSAARGDADAAIDAWNRVIQVRPQFAPAWTNLGAAFQDAARIDDAIACYRHASSIDASSPAVDNLLYAIHFHPAYGPQRIAAEHRRWNEAYITPLLSRVRPHRNDPSPRRRLRVGYVSPDFRGHPIGRFMLPLLTHHDRDRFEVFCYSDVTRDGPFTARLRERTDIWRDTLRYDDQRLAGLIADDRIDVLIDLTMHMSGNRMLMFARKPAPVQVTYLAYCSTTGSEAIDYRLTDRFLDPPGIDDSVYSEKSVRLRTYWCYPAPPEAPDVAPLPALAPAPITFGCLNNPCKMSATTLACWAEILRRVPNSRLMIHSNQLSRQVEITNRMAANGINPDRLSFVGVMSTERYFLTYNQIDIGLDPFPYPGGTTTCDALWMGVPVVSLAGVTAVSRGGASILSNLGLRRLVARDPLEYVMIASNLAGDIPALAETRQALRPRMRASSLMDGPGFTRDFERAFEVDVGATVQTVGATSFVRY